MGKKNISKIVESTDRSGWMIKTGQSKKGRQKIILQQGPFCGTMSLADCLEIIRASVGEE